MQVRWHMVHKRWFRWLMVQGRGEGTGQIAHGLLWRGTSEMADFLGEGVGQVIHSSEEVRDRRCRSGGSWSGPPTPP